MRVAYLGKKSELASILKGMAQLSAEERPIIGQLGNSIRSSIEQAFEKARNHVTELETQKKIQAETLDVTLPAAKLEIGGLHPLTKVQTQLEDIFLGMGFTCLLYTSPDPLCRYLHRRRKQRPALAVCHQQRLGSL